jgi:hypothetical protein
MAEVTITLPSANEPGYNNPVEISTTLDAGDDVVVKDTDGNNIDATACMIDTDGSVTSRTQNQTDAQKTEKHMLAGGWHQPVHMHKIFATGTDAGLGMLIRRI